jgi:hypothetical protein
MSAEHSPAEVAELRDCWTEFLAEIRYGFDWLDSDPPLWEWPSNLPPYVERFTREAAAELLPDTDNQRVSVSADRGQLHGWLRRLTGERRRRGFVTPMSATAGAPQSSPPNHNQKEGI